MGLLSSSLYAGRHHTLCVFLIDGHSNHANPEPSFLKGNCQRKIEGIAQSFFCHFVEISKKSILGLDEY
jgi:hypothetical protein